MDGKRRYLARVSDFVSWDETAQSEDTKSLTHQLDDDGDDDGDDDDGDDDDDDDENDDKLAAFFFLTLFFFLPESGDWSREPECENVFLLDSFFPPC